MLRLMPIVTSALVLVAAPTLRADEPLFMNGGREIRNMSRSDCARKAVAALTAKAGLPCAEVTDDGNARGWSDKAAFLVLSFPTPDPDRIMIAIVGAGNKAETERVFTAVWQHVLDGPLDAKAATRVAPEGGKVPTAPCTLCWKFEERPAIAVLKLFDPAALICLVKKGYTATTGKGLTIGLGPGGRTTMMFLAPSAQGQSVRLNAVSATPGQGSGQQATIELLTQLVKMLYE